jgi:pyridoxine 5-phosphate synthase
VDEAPIREDEEVETMTRLGVNIDHVATLRQARGVKYPDPVAAAAIVEMAGADGIVIHLREDRRHIQDRDVSVLMDTVKTKLNLEMAATPEMVKIALGTKPHMVTLVPEKRQEVTTEGGLNVQGNKAAFAKTVAQLKNAGIVVSLFIDPNPKQIETSREVGADFVELHTGRYCDATTKEEEDREYKNLLDAVGIAFDLDLGINAGHGLNYFNVRRIAEIKEIEELSIGHSIVARAVLVGLDRAVRDMIELIK